MNELELKYGCNPNQKPSRIYMNEGELPVEVLNGKPGYINFLDAFNSWQLVRELKAATGLPSAASFKLAMSWPSPGKPDFARVNTIEIVTNEMNVACKPKRPTKLIF